MPRRTRLTRRPGRPGKSAAERQLEAALRRAHAPGWDRRGAGGRAHAAEAKGAVGLGEPRSSSCGTKVKAGLVGLVNGAIERAGPSPTSGRHQPLRPPARAPHPTPGSSSSRHRASTRLGGLRATAAPGAATRQAVARAGRARPNQAWEPPPSLGQAAAPAIINLVSLKWIARLVTVEEASSQVEVVFDRALEAETVSRGLVAPRPGGRAASGPACLKTSGRPRFLGSLDTFPVSELYYCCYVSS